MSVTKWLAERCHPHVSYHASTALVFWIAPGAFGGRSGEGGEGISIFIYFSNVFGGCRWRGGVVRGVGGIGGKEGGGGVGVGVGVGGRGWWEGRWGRFCVL